MAQVLLPSSWLSTEAVMRRLLARFLLASVRLGTERAMGRFGRTPKSKWYRFRIDLGIVLNTHPHMNFVAGLLLTACCTHPRRINASSAHNQTCSKTRESSQRTAPKEQTRLNLKIQHEL